MGESGSWGPSRAAPAGPGAASTTITVVVPVKNEARRIARCLAALRSQTVPPDEIIVVDGRSADATVEIAKRFGVRVFFEDDHTRAGANQVGLQEARGDLVAFTDADCIPDPRWLERLAEGLEAGVVGVGGRIENEGETFWQRAIDAALDTIVGSANSVQGRPFSERRFVSSISGCNSIYRRKDLLDVGGFRTDLVTTEDTELNRRMLERGKLLYVPDAVVHHRHERGLRDFARRMFQYGVGRGQSLLPGPPLVVAFGLPFLAALALLRADYAGVLLALYGVVLVASAVGPSLRHREPRLLGALPLIFVIEHASYAVGFWKGLFRRRAPSPRTSPAPRGDPE